MVCQRSRVWVDCSRLEWYVLDAECRYWLTVNRVLKTCKADGFDVDAGDNNEEQQGEEKNKEDESKPEATDKPDDD